MFVGESGVSRVIQRTAQVMNELKTDDPALDPRGRRDRPADDPALPQLPLLGDDRPVRRRPVEQRRHLLQLGPEGALRGRQAHRRPPAQGPDLQGPGGPERAARREGGADAQRAERGAARRLHQGLDRRRRPLEQGPREGRPRRTAWSRRTRPSTARSARSPASASRPTAASSARPSGRRTRPSGCRATADRAFVASLMGRGRRAGQVRRLDRAAGDRHQPPAGRVRVRPLRLKPGRRRTRGRPSSTIIRMDTAVTDSVVFKQHLIDPEICIRCNTCEATCPVGAITHDDRNYVVRADVCNLCMACIAPCPTGSIDNWRTMPRARAYPVEDQLAVGRAAAGADARPAGRRRRAVRGRGRGDRRSRCIAVLPEAAAGEAPFNSAAYGATVPPWSAAHPYTNLFGPKNPTTATVVGNVNCTEAGFHNQTHHIVLDFGAMPFPVLEGQSIGIVPPGLDGRGRPHVARQYSIASPRNGERPGYNNVSLTVKRVTEDHQGRPVRGVASNYLCDLKVGDSVQVIGPFGQSLPDAEPSALAHRDDLHRHRQRADARDDRMAAAPAQDRQVRGRQADAVLRRAHARGAAVLRPAAERCRRTSSTSTSRSRAPPARRSATCRTCCASAPSTSCGCSRDPDCALLRLRPEGDGRGRGARAARRRRGRGHGLGRHRRRVEARRPVASRNVLTRARRTRGAPSDTSVRRDAGAAPVVAATASCPVDRVSGLP